MRVLLVSCCVLWGVLLGAGGLGATPLRPAFDREGEGLSVAQAGVGLQRLRAGSRTLTIDVGGTVELAWLYWSGDDRPCQIDPVSGLCGISVSPYKDQILRLDNVRVNGQVLGMETEPVTGREPILHLAYGADVTELVRAKGSGRVSFRISDADTDNNLTELDGAGLLVLYTVPGGAPARVLGFHGSDYAFGESLTPGDPTVTSAVTFAHGAAKRPRRGAVVLFVGRGQKDRRPDQIEIRGNQVLADRLDGSSGPAWDTERLPVDVAGGSLSTTVQLLSEPWGKSPDSLLWVAAALWLPLPEPEGCTAGAWSERQQWTETGLSPGQKVRDVFTESFRYGGIGNIPLRAALRFQGGGGVVGSAKVLIREASAAMLNSTYRDLEYPYSRSQVITLTDRALHSGDSARMGELASLLREANEAGCD